MQCWTVRPLPCIKHWSSPMSILKDPILFSQQFGVSPIRLAKLGVLDIILNADTKLFVDPLLLSFSSHKEIKEMAVDDFERRFEEIILLLQYSKAHGDRAWRAAEGKFRFREPIETGLGYSDGTTHGSAIGLTLRNKLLDTAKEIIDLGILDPRLFALLGLLEEGIGPDRISDITTNAIAPALVRFNERIAESLGLDTKNLIFCGTEGSLVANPLEGNGNSPIILTPLDLLRELPVAHSWSDIADAAAKNDQLRREVNGHIGNIWITQTRESKRQAREAVLRSRAAFDTLFSAVGFSSHDSYDTDADLSGHLIWREILTNISSQHPLHLISPPVESVDELDGFVRTIISQFSDLVENKDLWKLLWHQNKPRRECSSQLMFYGIADSYCKANNVDISPETNSGGGPVDFKFSSGYNARVLVEVKLSRGRVVHGYEKQLEIYKKAAGTTRAHLLIIDVGGMGNKLDVIQKIRNRTAASGEPASEFHVVDGNKQKSASVW